MLRKSPTARCVQGCSCAGGQERGRPGIRPDRQRQDVSDAGVHSSAARLGDHARSLVPVTCVRQLCFGAFLRAWGSCTMRTITSAVCLDLAKMISHSFSDLARTLRAQGNPARRADWGLVPFAAAELLARVAAAAGSGRSYLITLSVVELYGEHLRDLLAGPGTPFYHPMALCLQQLAERPALLRLGEKHTQTQDTTAEDVGCFDSTSFAGAARCCETQGD